MIAVPSKSNKTNNIMKTVKIIRTGILMLLAAFMFLTFTGCSQKSNKAKTQNEAEITQPAEEIDEIDEVWVVSEKELNKIPVKPTEKKKTVPLKKNDDKVISAKELEVTFIEEEYEPTPVAVKEAVVPLDETQTVVAYNKKGKEQNAIQVVSDSDGQVDKVIFYNKKHKDVYNVKVGMKGKEVRKLRRQMKHLEKDGKVFLYDDNSNIMYLMKAVNLDTGAEVTTGDIDNMDVQAIIWKDKKHSKK